MSGEEEWRPVPGYPGYEVSSLGRVTSRRRARPQLLRSKVGSSGYLTVHLSRGRRGDYGHALVHRLVAEAFLGSPPACAHTRHLDGDKSNNAVENLAWGTPRENALDQIRHGTHPYAGRTHCANGHLYDEANTSVDRTRPTSRRCLACHRANEARRRARVQAARKQMSI